MTISLIQEKSGYAKGVLHVIIYLHEIKMLQEKRDQEAQRWKQMHTGLTKKKTYEYMNI